MATSDASEVIQHLRRTVLLPDGAGLTDGQLLESFLSRRDEAAMEVLVRRHGSMVWGVCRRVLRNHHDAEDAFQATFLVLVRKAPSIASRELLANWLYCVAHQTALKARTTVAKRRGRERQATEMPEPAVAGQAVWDDLQPLLDQELSRLPEKYRAVIMLCDLEGKTRKEAAQQFSLPEGMVASRLARARVMLAKRLARHGLTLAAGTLAGVLTQNAASASVPASVVLSTGKAIAGFAAGHAAAVAVKAGVEALAERVLKAMLLSKIKTVVVVVLAATLLTVTVGMVSRYAAAGHGEQQPQRKSAEGPVKAEEPKGANDEKAHTAWGKEQGWVQAGLGYRPGQRRAYRLGETITLVIRVRNVGKEKVLLQYHPALLLENPPIPIPRTIAFIDADGKPATFSPSSKVRVKKELIEKQLAPGQEVELDALDIALKPGSKDDVADVPTLFAKSGKYRVRMNRLAPIESSNVLSTLTTGDLELEVLDAEKGKEGEREGRLHKADQPFGGEMTFGSVRERGVTFDFFDKKTSYLDLDTGDYVEPRAAEADVCTAAGLSDTRARIGLKLVAVPVSDAKFESATPAEVAAEVRKHEAKSSQQLGGPVRTYYVKTAAGNVGVLQVVPVEGDTTGLVKVRWKFIRRAAAATDAEDGKGGGKEQGAKPRNDRQLIQGRWEVAKVELSGPSAVDEGKEEKEVVITGDTMTVVYKTRTYPMQYTLDPAKQPRAIDLVPTTGGAEKGETFKGIYKLEEVLGIGDELTVCFSRNIAPGAARPTTFDWDKEAREDRGRRVYQLRRPAITKADLHGEWESPVNGVFESGWLALRPDGTFRYEMHDVALGWTTTVTGAWTLEDARSLVLREQERLQDGRPVKGQDKKTEKMCPVWKGGDWCLGSYEGGREFRKVKKARADKRDGNELAFGPVLERDMTSQVERKTSYLDLDTGNHTGPDVAGTDVAAFLGNSDGRATNGVNLIAVSVPDAKFDSATPAEVAAAVAKEKPQARPQLGGNDRTYFFKTAEGNAGVLQVIPVKGDANVVKVRWKLVRSGGTADAAPEKINRAIGKE